MANTAPLWLFAGATLLWGATALVGASDGGESLYDTLLYFYGGLLFGGATLAVAMLFVIRSIGRRGVWRRLLPLPVVLQLGFLALVFLGVSFDQAFRARFAVSRGALQAAVEGIQIGRRRAEPGWIGLFRVRETDTAGRSVRFITAECFVDDCGFAYSKEGEPPRLGEDIYVHLDGPWWRWHRSW